MSDDLEEKLRKLTPRAIVAFAARCALRVRPIYASQSVGVDRAIQVAVGYAGRIDAFDAHAADAAAAAEIEATVANEFAVTAAEAAADADAYADSSAAAANDTANVLAAEAAIVAAKAYTTAAAARDTANKVAAAAYAVKAAAHAAKAAAYASANDVAAYDVNEIAKVAANAVTTYVNADAEKIASKAINDANDRDCDALAVTDRQRIDVSETGPLGPLWPEGEPEWFTAGKHHVERIIADATEPEIEGPTAVGKRDPIPQIHAYFDASGFTDEDVANCLKFVNQLYRHQGGQGLKIVDGKSLAPCHEEAEV